MKRLFTLLGLSLLFMSATFAQDPGSVSGKLQDVDGEALPFANVLLFSSSDTSLVKAGFTNDEGVFRLVPVPAGSYFVQATYVGLAPYRSEVIQMTEGQQLELPPVTMTAADTEIDAVQITAMRPLVSVKPDMTVFNVEGTINAQGENAFDLLRKAPGVMIDNNDNIMLLGKQGVRIMVDGKPSPLSNADLANLLKSMNSNQIESFEIITNPGAKFDAEGNAGIINIKMKRDKNSGVNGTVELGYIIGTYSKYNGSASINYRKNKIAAYASYSAGTGLRRNFMFFNRVQTVPVANGTDTVDVPTFYNSDTEMLMDFTNHNFRTGVDYYAGKRSTFGVMASGFIQDGTWSSESTTLIGPDSTGVPVSILDATATSPSNRTNLNFNANYRFDNGKGNTWSVDADYGLFNLKSTSFQPNTYFAPDGQTVLGEDIFSNNTPTDINIYTFKVDHERMVGKGKLGAGVKFSYVETDNTFDFYNVINGVEVLDPEVSNQFVYTENVNAGYVNYQTQIKKWGINAGLRVENTNSLGDLTAMDSTQDKVVDLHYTNLFPSAGLTYSLNQSNMFRLTYGRRIDRPRYQDLNPFENRISALAYQRGNEFLRPQFTHNIQLTHTYKYTLNTTLSYSHTTGFFTEITYNNGDGSTFLTKENLSTRDVMSLNVSYPRQIAKWWSTFTNVSGTYMRTASDFTRTTDLIDLDRAWFNVYHQSSFTLPKDITVQLSGFYNSPGVWGANWITEDFWGIEVGARKKLMKGRATFSVGVTDIFFTMQWRATQDFDDQVSAGGGGWESRTFKANFSYNFGNQKVKTRKRKTGNKEEADRLGGGGGGGAPGGN